MKKRCAVLYCLVVIHLQPQQQVRRQRFEMTIRKNGEQQKYVVKENTKTTKKAWKVELFVGSTNLVGENANGQEIVK